MFLDQVAEIASFMQMDSIDELISIRDVTSESNKRAQISGDVLSRQQRRQVDSILQKIMADLD